MTLTIIINFLMALYFIGGLVLITKKNSEAISNKHVKIIKITLIICLITSMILGGIYLLI